MPPDPAANRASAELHMDWQRLVNDVKSALAKWPNHPGLKLLGKQLGVN